MFRERIQFLVALLLVVNGSLWSFQVAAVTLGEIELKSGLGEALRATIELIDDKNTDNKSFSAQLGTGPGTRGQEVVDQLDLSSLSFQVVENELGIRHLLIESPVEVQQPELDFLVELQWPNNSVVIRVKLLFLAESVAAVAQIIATDAASSVYKVSRGDTLWNVASGFRLDNVTIWQAMDSLFIANPGAFLEGDPSKIIIGSLINGPSENQIERQTGFVVADQLGLEIYGETSSNTAIVYRPTVIERSLESLDVSYSSEEIPYFKVTDSIVVNDSVDMIADYDGGDPIIEVEVVANQLGKSLSSNLKPVIVKPIGDLRPADGELIYEQYNEAKAKAEISDLRKVIISLNSEIKNLQNRVQLQKVKEDRAATQAAFVAKSGYLSGEVNITKYFIAQALVLLIGGALFLYMAVQRRSTVPDIINVSSQESRGVVDGSLSVPDILPRQDSSGNEIFDGTNPEPGDVFAREYEIGGDIQRSTSIIDNISFDEELDAESVANLDYLDMTENIDPVDVKLDLAETYADLGDISGAREILEEIISESNKEGKTRATVVLDKLNSDASR